VRSRNWRRDDFVIGKNSGSGHEIAANPYWVSGAEFGLPV